MIIKRIQIEDFETIDRFESSFDSRLAVLPPENAVTIIKAIGAALKSRFFAGGKLRKSTSIRAEIKAKERSYFVAAAPSPEANGFTYSVKTEDGEPCMGFYDAIRQSAEEESLSRFVFDRSNRYSARFMRYLDSEKYYAAGRFSELTEGIGQTRTFRSCLYRFMKAYVPHTPYFNENCRILLRNTGQFAVDGDSALNDTEEAIFEYLCFLEVNRFWRDVEAVRDFHFEAWPVFIDGLPIDDCKNNLSIYLKAALSLGRQVFINDVYGGKRYENRQRPDSHGNNESDGRSKTP